MIDTSLNKDIIVSMKYLEESNKNLISLRTSLIAVVALLTGGLVGLILSDVVTIAKIIFIVIGIYFDLLFISDILVANDELKRNIGVMKNESK